MLAGLRTFLLGIVTFVVVMTSGGGPGAGCHAGGVFGTCMSCGYVILHMLRMSRAPGNFTDIPNVLINNGFRVTHFQEEPVNLETAFMRLTKGLVQ